MKTLKNALFVMFVALMASCSSDDSDPVDNTPGNEEQSFEYSLNGQDIPMTIYGGYISGEMIFVSAGAADGRSIQLTFNVFGDIATATSFSTQGNVNSYMNHYFFKENYFDFEMVSLDNNQVKANFSGKLYDDQYDLDSDFVTVEGSFVIDLTNTPPPIDGLTVSATVNGKAWHEVEGGTTSGSSYSLFSNSDNEYSFSFLIDPGTIAIGNNTFNANSEVNKVVVYKYNTALGYEEELVSNNGTFNITSKTTVGNFTVIEGTFTVNAEHPETGADVTVTNGQFKIAYDF